MASTPSMWFERGAKGRCCGQGSWTAAHLVMPIFIGGRHGIFKAPIVQGSAPLLVSRPAPVELASCKALLRKAQQTGTLEDVLSGLKSSTAPFDDKSEESWDPIPSGTMSDASKRQLSPAPNLATKIGKTGLSPAGWSPVTSDQWKQLECAGHGILPPDVPSVLKWSSTVIAFGKMKSENLSYMELLISKMSRAQGMSSGIASM